MTTPADLILTARGIYVDTDADLQRRSDADLLVYVNDAIKEISGLRPELFAKVGDVLCVTGSVEQAITFSDAQALLDVLCIHNGAALTPFDWVAMNAFNPGWRTDTAGTATQWSRLANDPLRFYIYPKAPATAQTLDVRYVSIPTELALGDTITEIPTRLHPAVIDYIIYRTESADDEHVLSQRAALAYQTFLAAVKGAT